MHNINLSDEGFERLKQIGDEIRQVAEDVTASARATMRRVQPILDDIALTLQALHVPNAPSKPSTDYYRQYEKPVGKKKRR